jgi:hypothetical protein
MPAKLTNQSRKQPGFKDSQQKPHSRDSTEILHAAQSHRDGSPGQHEERNPVAGFQAFEHVIARDFEEGVGDQEDWGSETGLEGWEKVDMPLRCPRYFCLNNKEGRVKPESVRLH